jgi:phospholipase C
LHSIVDANGMPAAMPLYTPTTTVADRQLTISCNPPAASQAPAGTQCGDYAVNTTQPWYQPYSPGTADYRRLPPLTNTTIGDELSHAGVDWAWYSGGWSNANGDIGKPGWSNGATAADGCTDPNVLATAVWPNCPDKLFQFHHQAFNYFRNYAPGTVDRRQHLRDEAEFITRAQTGKLLPVSFIKPIGAENEHPGYASESGGSSHLVDLINAVLNGPDGDKTLIVVTYDEFGGQWDHVPSPGAHGPGHGPHDAWGPGTRIPALLVAKRFAHSGVDHVEHDTTSLIATLEHMYNLQPLGHRDATVPDLTSAADQGLYGTSAH